MTAAALNNGPSEALIDEGMAASNVSTDGPGNINCASL